MTPDDEPLVIVTRLRPDKTGKPPLVSARCWRHHVTLRSSLDHSAPVEAKHAEAVSYILTELQISYRFTVYSAWGPEGVSRVHMILPRN